MNSKAFRTVSIILIIFGILGIVGGITTLSNSTTGAVTVIIGLLFNAVSIYAGIMGTKAVKTGDEDKAALCKKLSYVMLAITVVNIVVGFVTSSTVDSQVLSAGTMMGVSIVSAVISLILPVLYLLGAKRLCE